MVLYIKGLYFALRSGKEHRNLRFSSSQMETVNKDGERPYILYTEDCSKKHPGGLKGRRIKRKAVKHCANTTNPHWCFVSILQKYRELCPPNPIPFYLQPLKRPTATCWFSQRSLLGTTSWRKQWLGCVPRLNHSLRATILFSNGADEQLIMERTGHRSVDGVRSYKRTSDHLNEEVSDILNRSEKREKTHIQSDSSCPPTITPSSCLPVISPPTCPPVIAPPS